MSNANNLGWLISYEDAAAETVRGIVAAFNSVSVIRDLPTIGIIAVDNMPKTMQSQLKKAGALIQRERNMSTYGN